MAKNADRTQTKVFFTEQELRLVKLAAVSRGLTASEFARQAALKEATQEMANFVPPTVDVGQAAARKKRPI